MLRGLSAHADLATTPTTAHHLTLHTVRRCIQIHSTVQTIGIAVASDPSQALAIFLIDKAGASGVGSTQVSFQKGLTKKGDDMTKRRFFATLHYRRIMKHLEDEALRKLLLGLFQYAYTCGWQDKMMEVR